MAGERQAALEKTQDLRCLRHGTLLKFAAFLRHEKEQSPRSCWNKFSNVMTFLTAQGIR